MSWSFIDNFVCQTISLIVGIVLARLVSPAEFGIVAYITVFIVISTSFVDSGFGSALIRKKDCTTTDCSTVFYFNFAGSLILYMLLFFLAPVVESFFVEPGLSFLLRIAGCVLIINALGNIQQTLLVKRVDFKTKTKISIASDTLAGIFAIVLAYKGYGVWSLVWRSLLGTFLTSVLLWIFNEWRPKLVFSVKSFKELFGFGYKLALSGLIDMIFSNMLVLIIGKIFSPATLGQYTQAGRYSGLFSSTLTINIQRVSFPILATIQDDPERLKKGYQRMIKSTMIVTFACMLGLAAIAQPLIVILIGETWLPCVPYLQLMCFSSMLYPLHAMNLNAITVKGRSDLFLKLEIIKKMLYIPIIMVAIYKGVIALLIGNIIISFISYLLNSYYSADLIRYPTKVQILDVLPLLLVSLFVSGLVWCITLLGWNNWLTIILQIGVGAGLTIGIYEILKQPDYLEIKRIGWHFVDKIRGKIKKQVQI
jgi:O-antigen/teichoic acid export membrane protein